MIENELKDLFQFAKSVQLIYHPNLVQTFCHSRSYSTTNFNVYFKKSDPYALYVYIPNCSTEQLNHFYNVLEEHTNPLNIFKVMAFWQRFTPNCDTEKKLKDKKDKKDKKD